MPDFDPLRWLGQELSLQLAKALEGMAGQSYPVTFEAATTAHASTPEFWWDIALSGLPKGSGIRIGAVQDAWQTIGRTLLEAIGLDTDEASVKSTYIETIAQAVSAMASAIGTRLGTEVTAGSGAELTVSPSTGYAIQLALGLLESSPSVITVVFSSEFISALTPKPAIAEPVSTSGGTIDLLLDVELPVSVSFGRTELPLKDVAKLTTGSIVELNRSISEPVEIIVNNCVIARGEVVVIEGNYGVRIDQIISRQERLRTLK